MIVPAPFRDGVNGENQFAGQELRASKNNNMFYWRMDARGSNAETDYMIEKEGKIVPIEVKSGKTGKIRSLHLLLDRFNR